MLIHDARTQLQANPGGWRDLNAIYGGILFADSGRYEISALPWVKSNEITIGTCTAPQRNELDGSFSFACIRDHEDGGRPRSFEEARGYVMSDYQQKIEEEWIARLKKKYPVKINQAEWQKLLASVK
jgi:peptidyl-prolyl cis-trans isomerase SurA